MKRVLYICFFVSLTLFVEGQSVFSRIKADMLSKNNKKILDSCDVASYFMDSALYYKGMIELKMNKVNQAKLTCKELIRRYPEFSEVHYLLGLIHLSGDSYGKSITEFSILLEKTPKHLKGLYNRALAFGLMEEYDKAIEDLSTCISLKPIYSLAYYSRAYWHEYLGNYPSAIKDYETTINLDPKNYDAYFGLAYIYQGLKTDTKSCEVINNAIQAGSQIAEEIKTLFCK